MAKWNDYTLKSKPADNDNIMISDSSGGGVNKRVKFSGLWNWIVGKLTNAVISQLETTNKNVVGAINELNSNLNAIFLTQITNDMLANGWQNNATSYAYKWEAIKLAFLNFTVRNGTMSIGTLVGTLPESLWPVRVIYVSDQTSGGMFKIDTNGEITTNTELQNANTAFCVTYATK